MGKYKKFVQCPYNEGCRCKPKDKECDKCGWNPVVAEKRKKVVLS